MSLINPTAPVGRAGRQSIVSLFSQGNIVPALIITAVAILFYYDGLQVYFHGEIWTVLAFVKELRSSFYISSDYGLPRPVEYAVEDLIFDINNPLLFHAPALGLHAANSILVFLILKKVVNSQVGLAGALLFTSFYAHPEVVTYFFGINEDLRATFCLSCIILFYRYRRNPTKTNYALTLGAFILTLGSKETTAVVLPPLLYLVDSYLQIESKTENVKLNKAVYIPFIIMSIGWSILVYIIWGNPTEDSPRSPRNLLILYLPQWREWFINLYLSIVSSFNLCSLKGPGSGTSVLILSLVLSFLPLFDIRTRRCIILLWVGWLVTIIPLILGGMNLRYLYITSAFSMAIFATCVYHLIVYVIGRLRLKEAYVTALTILVISIPVTTNFLYVSRHVEYLKDTGRVSESLWKLLLADFPTGTLGTKLIFINFPWTYEPAHGGYIGTRHVILFNTFHNVLGSVYGRCNVGPTYQFTLSELYEGRHLLGPDMPKLSPQEFEKLAREKGTKVYLFNPRNDTVLDATGKDYNSLKKLLSHG